MSGKHMLIDFLRTNSKDQVAFAKSDDLMPGKIYFTVTKEGTITKAKFATTSGYTSIDDHMLELITKVPGEWKPAQNAKGELVDQTLVFAFGIVGC